MVRVADSQVEQLMQTSSSEETVSVVIPCYNEERFIGKALEQLADQFAAERYEIIVVDGMSSDRTRAVISEFSKQHPQLSVRVVDNPARNIPTALNVGVAAATGTIIARMDAHAVPSDGYIRRCVEVLQTGAAGVVGMPCMVRPGADTSMARAIAAAVSHPFGIGDAKYRLGAGGPPQESVDTVAFACFRKSLWQQLGGFNESLLTNEDYDFNYRVRQAGFDVVLDRAGHCDYFARSTLRGLAEQYWRYGSWKARMLRLHPASIKLRHLVAPAFLTSLIFLFLLGWLWRPALVLFGVETIVYLVLALLCGWQAARKQQAGLAMTTLIAIAFFTIHTTWGMGFMLGLFRSRAHKNG
jgi:glycosyltransferase involved in cell wall biosynthesis